LNQFIAADDADDADSILVIRAIRGDISSGFFRIPVLVRLAASSKAE